MRAELATCFNHLPPGQTCRPAGREEGFAFMAARLGSSPPVVGHARLPVPSSLLLSHQRTGVGRTIQAKVWFGDPPTKQSQAAPVPTIPSPLTKTRFSLQYKWLWPNQQLYETFQPHYQDKYEIVITYPRHY